MTKRRIKDILFSLIFLGVFIILMGFCGYIETHYTRQATVIEVNGDVITVEDNCGYLWDFKGNGFTVGDNVSMKMYNNTTDSIIKDDKIINVTINK